MNNYGIADHTVEHFRKNPKDVLAMIKEMKKKIKDKNLRHAKDGNIHILKQWRYIAYRLGLTDKVKVIFS